MCAFPDDAGTLQALAWTRRGTAAAIRGNDALAVFRAIDTGGPFPYATVGGILNRAAMLVEDALSVGGSLTDSWVQALHQDIGELPVHRAYLGRPVAG